MSFDSVIYLMEIDTSLD